MIENDEFGTRAILYGIISDMINISEKYYPKEFYKIKDVALKEKTADKQNIFNIAQDNIILRVDTISRFLSTFKDRITQNILNIYNSVFKSIKLLTKNEYDSISQKNKISLYIFSYYIVAHFYSLLTKKDEPLKYFREDIIINISKLLSRDNLIKAAQNIINNSSNTIFEKNKRNGNFDDILLITIKNLDFENKYNEYIIRQNNKKLKKKEKKEEKEKERKKEDEKEKECENKNEKIQNMQNKGEEKKNKCINRDIEKEKESNMIREIKEENP